MYSAGKNIVYTRLLQVCEGPGSAEAQELECSELCPCRTLQARARADRYIFSLAR